MIIGPAQGIYLAIEDCINSAVYLNSSQFQSFQTFNRFAPFKTFREILKLRNVQRTQVGGSNAIEPPTKTQPMARANRHFLPGHVWHITHLCSSEFQSFNRCAPFKSFQPFSM